MLDIVVKVSNVIHGPYDFKNDQVKSYVFCVVNLQNLALTNYVLVYKLIVKELSCSSHHYRWVGQKDKGQGVYFTIFTM